MNLSNLSNLANIAVPVISIGGCIITAIILWTKISDKVGSLDGRVKVVEEKVEKLNPIWQQIQIDLADIKATLKYYLREK